MKTEISLVGNPSTGYGWEPDRKPDDVSYETRYPVEEEIVVDGQVFKDFLIGGEVFETFVFNDLAPGTVLTFSYLRAWRKDKEPVRTVQLLVEAVE